MTSDEFKERVDKMVRDVLGRYPNEDDCEFFIGDMEDLIADWEDEK